MSDKDLVSVLQENDAEYGGRDSAGKQPPLPARKILSLIIVLLAGIGIGLALVERDRAQTESAVQVQAKNKKAKNFDAKITANMERLLEEGKNTFRFDTFGDEEFWGGSLKLHQAIEGSTFGGVGAGGQPASGIGFGLKSRRGRASQSD